jgi:polyisoprenoid-binding protein YceI
MAHPNHPLDTAAEMVGTWILDPGRSTVEFQTKAMWVIPVTGTLQATEGTGTIGPDGRMTGRLVIDAASIDTKNKRRDTHLRTAHFFEVDKYPTITFQVDDAQFSGAGQVSLLGNLTVHGVTRPVQVHGTVTSGQDGSITLNASAEVDRSQFGLPWAKMGAGLYNKITAIAVYRRR